jgi:5-methyltetrahydropteroyltriglutamate--homocysteine methyltransferase
MINPDCGLRHLPPGIARAKLAAMVAGAALVRAELGTGTPPGPHPPEADATQASTAAKATEAAAAGPLASARSPVSS